MHPCQNMVQNTDYTSSSASNICIYVSSNIAQSVLSVSISLISLMIIVYVTGSDLFSIIKGGGQRLVALVM